MKLFVFDVETGGFSPEKNPVCEIAVVIVDLTTLQKVDSYEAVVAPYKIDKTTEPIYNPKALEVNGLSMKKIEAGVPAREVVQNLVALAKKHKDGREKVVLCGHNIDKFDIPMIGALLTSNGCTAPEKLFAESTIDTLQYAKLIWPTMGSGQSILNRQLGTVCQQFDIELINAHSAMPDTVANADMIISIIRRMRASGMQVVEETFQVKSRKNFHF